MLAPRPGVNFELVPTLVLRAAGGDLYYAFDVATGDHFRLNETSYWILETIGEGIAWEGLVRRFLDEFDVPAGPGIADLTEIIQEFHQQSIIREVPNEAQEAAV